MAATWSHPRTTNHLSPDAEFLFTAKTPPPFVSNLQLGNEEKVEKDRAGGLKKKDN